MRKEEIEFILEDLEYELIGLSDGDEHDAEEIQNIRESIEYYKELL